VVSSRFVRADWIAWTVFALAALLALRVPFTGDQYFFALGARALAEGGRLYVDFWDIKQPGIYYLYWAATRLPFDPALAVRLLEICAWAAVAVFAGAILRRAGVVRDLAALAPIAASLFLLSAPAWHLSQVESFVVLPLTVIAWLLVSSSGGRREWVVLGAAAAIVAWLKLVLLVVPIGLVAAVFWFDLRGSPPFDFRLWAERVGAAAVGFFAGGAILLFPLLHDRSFGAFVDASWSYPLTAMAALERAPISRLVWSVARWGILMSPLLAIALLGVITRRASRVEAILWGWLVCAGLAIGIQSFSWWAYQTTLLIVPVALLGLLAASKFQLPGAPRLAPASGVATAALVATVGIAALLGWRKVNGVATGLFVSTPSVEYEAALAPGYEELRALGAAFRRDSPPGASLCVLADPALAVHAGAHCPSTVHMWSEPAMNEEKWRQMATELENGKPDLLYLARSMEAVLQERQPEIPRWLRANYVVWRAGPRGDVWLRRKDFPSAIH
jgi:hypothetical protein